MILIEFIWDDEAQVWIAIGEGIGLALESKSYDMLVERVKLAVPEMAAENNISYSNIVIIVKENPYYVVTNIINGIASQGLTIDEALANLKEATELYYEK